MLRDTQSSLQWYASYNPLSLALYPAGVLIALIQAQEHPEPLCQAVQGVLQTAAALQADKIGAISQDNASEEGSNKKRKRPAAGKSSYPLHADERTRALLIYVEDLYDEC